MKRKTFRNFAPITAGHMNLRASSRNGIFWLGDVSEITPGVVTIGGYYVEYDGVRFLTDEPVSVIIPVDCKYVCLTGLVPDENTDPLMIASPVPRGIVVLYNNASGWTSPQPIEDDQKESDINVFRQLDISAGTTIEAGIGPGKFGNKGTVKSPLMAEFRTLSEIYSLKESEEHFLSLELAQNWKAPLVPSGGATGVIALIDTCHSYSMYYVSAGATISLRQELGGFTWVVSSGLTCSALAITNAGEKIPNSPGPAYYIWAEQGVGIHYGRTTGLGVTELRFYPLPGIIISQIGLPTSEDFFYITSLGAFVSGRIGGVDLEIGISGSRRWCDYDMVDGKPVYLTEDSTGLVYINDEPIRQLSDASRRPFLVNGDIIDVGVDDFYTEGFTGICYANTAFSASANFLLTRKWVTPGGSYLFHWRGFSAGGRISSMRVYDPMTKEWVSEISYLTPVSTSEHCPYFTGLSIGMYRDETRTNNLDLDLDVTKQQAVSIFDFGLDEVPISSGFSTTQFIGPRYRTKKMILGNNESNVYIPSQTRMENKGKTLALHIGRITTFTTLNSNADAWKSVYELDEVTYDGDYLVENPAITGQPDKAFALDDPSGNYGAGVMNPAGLVYTRLVSGNIWIQNGGEITHSYVNAINSVIENTYIRGILTIQFARDVTFINCYLANPYVDSAPGVNTYQFIGCTGPGAPPPPSGGGAFENTGTVVRQDTTSSYTENYVFGSPQLDDDTIVTHDVRLQFNKAKGAFQAGRAWSTQFDDANTGMYSSALGNSITAPFDNSHIKGLGGETLWEHDNVISNLEAQVHRTVARQDVKGVAVADFLPDFEIPVDHAYGVDVMLIGRQYLAPGVGAINDIYVYMCRGFAINNAGVIDCAIVQTGCIKYPSSGIPPNMLFDLVAGAGTTFTLQIDQQVDRNMMWTAHVQIVEAY